jgi:subtilisin-like proprotein convertase family protein
MSDGGRTHVIPNSINYSDVKPEQIENTVKLIRFTPTANVQSAGPNDVIKFMLQGNGFLDPFSTYIDIEVDIMPELTTVLASPQVGAIRSEVMGSSATTIG